MYLISGQLAEILKSLGGQVYEVGMLFFFCVFWYYNVFNKRNQLLGFLLPKMKSPFIKTSMYSSRQHHPFLPCWQFRCGQWHIFRAESLGSHDQPGIWPESPSKLCPQSASGVLPVPLRQRLWPLAKVHVPELLHCQWHVSMRLSKGTTKLLEETK